MFINKMILLVLYLTVLTFPQSFDIGCGTNESYSSLDQTQRGGRWLTASGELKVLVVFAKFQGDTEDHPYWPVNGYPIEMENFIDPNQETNSSHFLNLTNYFEQMSYYNFDVVGTAVGVTTPYPKSHYIQQGNTYPDRAMANKDILVAADDQVNYNEFDSWTYVNDYDHDNLADGIIDMVIVVWRGLVFTEEWSGEASLGWGEEFRVENNQKIIRMGYKGNPTNGSLGSGVTIQYWGEKTPERNFKVCVHELAHWLIHGNHPYNQDNYQFWGMLTLGDQSICANSFEKEKLAWLNPTPITGPILAAPLSDYVTTPVAYKYNPSNGTLGETYYFENHQRLSTYDNITSNSNDKGIFILHLQNYWYEGDCMRVLSSDGFWSWESPYTTNCWNSNLPAFYRTGVNRNGYGHRDKIQSENNQQSFLYAFVNDDYQVECNDWLYGYGFNSSFTLNYNDVFSPWSNPRATTWNGQLTDFIMQVNSNDPIISVSFATQNSINAKPSKPPLGWNPTTPSYQYGWIYLAWNPTMWDGLPSESDLNWSELQRKIGVNGTWTTVYSGANRYWSDHSMTYDPNGAVSVYFRVRVRDSQNKWSMWSDIYDTKAFKPIYKGMAGNQTENPGEYVLAINYPNPFNPSTIINYSIKDAGLVKIKVFDILGSEVATLVNETKEAGDFAVEFNAANLPSGVYIYTLRVNGFSDSKKMLLLK